MMKHLSECCNLPIRLAAGEGVEIIRSENIDNSE